MGGGSGDLELTAEERRDEAEPPKWSGQQAGCVAAVAAGAIGLVLFVGALVLLWILLHGGA